MFTVLDWGDDLYEEVLIDGQDPVEAVNNFINFVNIANGFTLLRLGALSGQAWMAELLAGIFGASQHISLPPQLDWDWFAMRFFGVLPLIIIKALIYLRLRRLLPLIVMHWLTRFICPQNYLYKFPAFANNLCDAYA